MIYRLRLVICVLLLAFTLHLAVRKGSCEEVKGQGFLQRKADDEFQLRVMSWNVAGGRDFPATGRRVESFRRIVRAVKPDVICLQEIKALPEQIAKEDRAFFEPYHACWNPAEKKGYSGVALYTRRQPVSVEVGGLGEVGRDRAQQCPTGTVAAAAHHDQLVVPDHGALGQRLGRRTAQDGDLGRDIDHRCQFRRGRAEPTLRLQQAPS